MKVASDTGTLLNQWWDGLDERLVDEAWCCLLEGTYSRPLLDSLREVLGAGVPVRHGLDDPHTVAAGDPLGATLQTVLRERLLGRNSTPAHDARWLVPAQRRRG